jgi:subtilisin family serine protease
MAERRDDDLVNHLPDEVCVRVRAPGTADASRLYEQVRSAVNRYLQAPPTRVRDLPGPLVYDLEARGLTTARRPDEVLQPLGRARVQAIGIGADVWHFYYRLEPAMQRVRELTNLLNLAALGQADRPSEDGWSLEGGSPNWLTSALPFSCGSPAALPFAAQSAVGSEFEFGESVRALLSDGHGRPRARVIVAVLDTCPSVLDDHGNATLRDLLGKLQIARGEDLPHYVTECVPWWQERMPPEPMPRPEFALPDHGLFVAGIVAQIAPDAELHLVQVLNDYGVGDLAALEQVLRSLPETLLRDRPDARLIVNLSLGSAVPVPRRRYFSRWLPRAHSAAQGAWPVGLANDLLEGAHAGLAGTIRWLYEQGVLVVAAAGNDALREHLGGVLPPPRYPAYYESVLAVAAAGPSGRPAAYSNRGDVQPFGNGITTLGGDVVVRRADQPPLTAEDGIVGVYSSPTLPTGEPNRSGWVRWSGTSFSTAIISGLAARLWQQDANQQPADLMHRLRSSAHDIASRRAQGTDPDGPLDAPYLEVHQR